MTTQHSQSDTDPSDHTQALSEIVPRPVAVIGIYILCWYVLRWGALQFQVVDNISLWNPPTALDVVLLLVGGLRYTPVLFITYLVDGLLRLSPLAAVLFALVSALGYGAVCRWLVRGVHIDPRLHRLRDVVWFVAAAAFVGPLVVTAIRAAILTAFGEDAWSDWLTNTLHGWAGDATGVAMLAPVLLILLRHFPRLWPDIAIVPMPPSRWRVPNRREVLEMTGQLLVLAFATWIAFGLRGGQDLDYQHVIMLPLIWIAVRHGFAPTSVVVLAVNIGAALIGAIQEVQLDQLALQFGLMSATLTGILLGAFTTERARTLRALREAEERFRSAFDDAAIAVALVYPNGSWMRVNPALCAMLGYAKSELWMLTYADVVHADDRAGDQERMEQALLGTAPTFQHETRYIHKHGHVVWGALSASLVRDARGRPVHWVMQIEDITERKQLEYTLAHQAFHDPLTNLPNRTLFMDRLRQALQQATRQTHTVAVMFLDLDNFKLINDNLGHGAGDRLLQLVAERLLLSMRAGDTCARFGGDEFTLLVDCGEHPHTVVALAERILEQLGQPFIIDGRELVCTGSLGIATTTGGVAADDLLRNADLALYRAKAAGPASMEVFDPSMMGAASERLEMETDLRGALQRQEFRLYYQPIIHLATMRVAELEALVRWQHPRRGLIGPGLFLALAEETGTIIPIGRWIIETACRDLRVWQSRFPDIALRVTVNLSAREIHQPHLVAFIETMLGQTGLDAAYLKLEITESTLLNDEAAAMTLRRLQALGVHLALDDFGIGYSSLAYLSRLPVNTLKIDRTFVQRMGTQPEDAAITHAIVALANALGLTTTAEGIETSEQLAHIQELGCDYGQGYFFAQPLPAEAIPERFARDNVERKA